MQSCRRGEGQQCAVERWKVSAPSGIGAAARPGRARCTCQQGLTGECLLFSERVLREEGAGRKLNMISKIFTSCQPNAESEGATARQRKPLHNWFRASDISEPHIILLSVFLASNCIEARPEREVIYWWGVAGGWEGVKQNYLPLRILLMTILIRMGITLNWIENL